MSRDIRKNPEHIAYHVVRSVPYDSCTLVGHVLVLKYGDEVMTIACGDVGDDVEVAVSAPGDGGWRTTGANDTDKIAQMWSRAPVRGPAEPEIVRVSLIVAPQALNARGLQEGWLPGTQAREKVIALAKACGASRFFWKSRSAADTDYWRGYAPKVDHGSLTFQISSPNLRKLLRRSPWLPIEVQESEPSRPESEPSRRVPDGALEWLPRQAFDAALEAEDRGEDARPAALRALQDRIAGFDGDRAQSPPAGLLRAEILVVESIRHNPPGPPEPAKPEQLEPKFWPEVW